MKKWICILLAAAAVMLLASCGGANDAAQAPTEPEPQLHTVVPTADLSEPEWAHINGAMTLEDGAGVYARGSDFLCFALVVNGDRAEIRFKLDDITAGMLREQAPGNPYYVTLDDKKLGDVELNENCDELTLVGSYTYEELCNIADRIRGFID